MRKGNISSCLPPLLDLENLNLSKSTWFFKYLQILLQISITLFKALSTYAIMLTCVKSVVHCFMRLCSYAAETNQATVNISKIMCCFHFTKRVSI